MVDERRDVVFHSIGYPLRLAYSLLYSFLFRVRCPPARMAVGTSGGLCFLERIGSRLKQAAQERRVKALP
jgi:hypothetical protein